MFPRRDLIDHRPTWDGELTPRAARGSSPCVLAKPLARRGRGASWVRIRLGLISLTRPRARPILAAGRRDSDPQDPPSLSSLGRSPVPGGPALDHGQSDAESPVVAVQRGVRLGEQVEDAGGAPGPSIFRCADKKGASDPRGGMHPDEVAESRSLGKAGTDAPWAGRGGYPATGTGPAPMQGLVHPV